MRIGYREPRGWLAGGMQAWRMAALPLATLPQWTTKELDARRRNMKELFILDVCQPREQSFGGGTGND